MLLLLLQALAERGRTQENRADPPAGRGNEATAKKGPRPGNTTKSQPTLGVLLLISLPAPLFIYTILCIGYCIVPPFNLQYSQQNIYSSFYISFCLNTCSLSFLFLTFYLSAPGPYMYFLSSIKKIIFFFSTFSCSVCLHVSCYFFTPAISTLSTFQSSIR